MLLVRRCLRLLRTPPLRHFSGTPAEELKKSAFAPEEIKQEEAPPQNSDESAGEPQASQSEAQEAGQQELGDRESQQFNSDPEDEPLGKGAKGRKVREGENLFSEEEEAEPPTPSSKLMEAFRWMMFTGKVVAFGLFGYTFYVYYNDKKVTTERPFIFKPFLGSVRYLDTKITDLYKLFTEPPIDKLLPDFPKMPAGYALPKTLVLDLKGTLISASYSLGVGFEVKMRPGLMEFLSKMAQMYEVVIFSDEDFQFTMMTAENLDPQHRIFSSRLSRESMCLRKGELIKDLSYLNRDLKNVIVVEKGLNRVKFHPDNVLVLPEYQGADDDRALIELIPFLEHVAKDQRVKDVREELDKYGHVDTGKKYIEHLRKIRDQITSQQQKGVSGLLMRPKR